MLMDIIAQEGMDEEEDEIPDDETINMVSFLKIFWKLLLLLDVGSKWRRVCYFQQNGQWTNHEISWKAKTHGGERIARVLMVSF